MLNNLRGNIRKTALALLGLLAALLIYISYVQVFESDFLIAHPLNRRAITAAERIERGQVLDRRGVKLAYSDSDEAGHFYRVYPFGPIFAHVVGYDSARYGTAGLESTYNGYLSGITNPERRLGPLANLLTAKAGNNLTLTIDSRLQETAYRALGGNRGAVVAIDPRTGAILAMASKPSFDPEAIDSEWSAVAGGDHSPLLNRASQGLYPPGSTLKVMVAEAALAEKIIDTRTVFTCEGSLKIGPDYVLNESGGHAHGRVDLEDALAVSCNVAFGTLGLNLGRDRMAKTFERYGFDRSTGDELQESASRLPDFAHLSDGDLAQTAIGQSSLLVTPLRMALLAAVFANNGTMMKPYLVSKITAPDGAVISEFFPQEFGRPVSAELAAVISKMMVTVVSSGTGYGAKLSGVRVAGKTGTAENPHGQPHAWFIGFAPADDPVIAVAVIVENGGAGGAVAAPIARQIIAGALR